MAGDRLAVDALGLLGEPFDETRAVEDLAPGLGQRLAHLRGQDRREVVGIGDDQVVPLAQHGGALLAGPRRPALAGAVRRVDGAHDLGFAEIGTVQITSPRAGFVTGNDLPLSAAAHSPATNALSRNRSGSRSMDFRSVWSSMACLPHGG